MLTFQERQEIQISFVCENLPISKLADEHGRSNKASLNPLTWVF